MNSRSFVPDHVSNVFEFDSFIRKTKLEQDYIYVNSLSPAKLVSKLFTFQDFSHYTSNFTVKKYLDGSILIRLFKHPFDAYRGEKNYITKDHPLSDKDPCFNRDLTRSNESIERSLRRSKTTITDYILNNYGPNALFVTLTNGNIPDVNCSQELKDIINDLFKKQILKKMQNLVARQGIRYILVPELTKNGFLHFHGFIWDLPEKYLLEAKSPYDGHLLKTKSGEQIYNLNTFDNNGFTNVTNVIHYDKAKSYILKYITKEMIQQKPNMHRYFCSKNLKKPEKYSGYSSSVSELKSEPLFHDFNYFYEFSYNNHLEDDVIVEEQEETLALALDYFFQLEFDNALYDKDLVQSVIYRISNGQHKERRNL